jgi:hypothetical protein
MESSFGDGFNDDLRTFKGDEEWLTFLPLQFFNHFSRDRDSKLPSESL